MNRLLNAIISLRNIEDNQSIDSAIHRLNPILKVTVCLVFILCVVSFDMYEIFGLVPYIITLFFVIILSEINITDVLRSLLLAMPLIFILALSSAIFNNQTFLFLDYEIDAGIIVFISIILKTSTTILSVIVLVCVTKSYDIFNSLAFYKVSKIFITLLFLIYRYIWILLDEVLNTYNAYSIRSFSENNGIKIKDFRSLVGQILIRTYEKGTDVYNAMLLRGYDINKNVDTNLSISKKEIVAMIIASAILLFFRFSDIINIIGSLFI